MTDSVFVYGTLKPGLRYHPVAQQGGAFEKEEAFLEGFELYHLHPENYPALIPGKDKVYGWIYTYKNIDKALVHLDELEGLHLQPPEYERVITIAKPGEKRVWVYLFLNQARLEKEGAVRLESGVWAPQASEAGLIPKGIQEG